MGKLKTEKILVVIFFLGLLLRLFKLGSVPVSLYWDEAAIALDAKAIVETGFDQHGRYWLQPVYPSWGDYKLPGYVIACVPFFNLIKNNVSLAVRLPSAIAGTLTILVVYFLTKQLLRDKIKNSNYLSIIASFLLVISPWHLQFSRAGFEANLALFFNSLALLFFLKADKKKIFTPFFIIFSVSAIYSYYSARIVLPFILGTAFWFFWKKNFKNILIFFLSLVLIFSLSIPLINNPLTQQAEQLRLSTKNILTDPEIVNYSSLLIEQDGGGFLARKIHHRFLYRLKILLSHYFDHFSFRYLLLQGDPNLRHSTGKIGVFLIPGLIGFILGEYWLFGKKKFFFSLNLMLLISFLPACIPYETPHALRSLNAVIFINIIGAFGLVYLIKQIKKSLWRYLFLFIFILQFLFYLQDYYFFYPQRSFWDWQYGYKQAVKKVWDRYPEYDKIYFTNAYHRAYLYFMLYSDYSIEDFQKQRKKVLRENELNYQETEKIDKVVFKDFKGENDSGSLLVVSQPGVDLRGKIIDRIFYNQELVFEIREMIDN